MFKNIETLKFKKIFNSKQLYSILKDILKENKENKLIKDLILFFNECEKEEFRFFDKKNFYYPLLSVYLNYKQNIFFKYEIDEFLMNNFIINSKKDISLFKLLNENENDPLLNSFLGCILGAACGDAFGAVLEFQPRDDENILTDMSSGGIHHVSKGEWTDDTAMLLCLMQSLIDKGFDLHDQTNNYIKWYKEGFMSTRKHIFDIGITTRIALDFYIKNKEFRDTTDEKNSGNGSIMRLAPIPIYFKDYQETLYYAEKSSIPTHQSDLSKDGCLLLAALINLIVHSNIKDKKELLFSEKIKSIPFKTEQFKNVVTFDFLNLSYDNIPNSGFVLDTLISAIWCFYHTDNYKDSIIKSANLGGDSDTIACVCGQLSGAFYGFNDIPKIWLKFLHSNEIIFNMTKELYLKHL